MKKCELCNKVARMYCESDEASLCWGCDLRVHTANFLVAKHTRTLLCHACQCPTPWTGSGPRLGPTVSVCEACANASGDRRPGNGPAEDDEEDEENGDHGREDDDDGENQVVPLSLPPSSMASTSTRSSDDSPISTSTTRDGLSSLSRPTTAVGNASFSYDVTERTEEKKGGKKMKSWMWR